MDFRATLDRSYTLEELNSAGGTLRCSPKAAIVIVGGLEAGALVALGLVSKALLTFVTDRSVDIQSALGVGCTAAFFFVAVGHSTGLYSMRRLLQPDPRRLLLVSFATILLVIANLFALKVSADLSRGFLAIFACLSSLGLYVGRLVARHVMSRAVDVDLIFGRSVVILGSSEELDRLRPADLKRFGIKEAGRVVIASTREGTTQWASLTAEAIRVARQLRADEFVIAAPWAGLERLEALESGLRASPLPVRLLPDANIRALLARHQAADPSVDHLVDLQRRPLNTIECLAKRLLDIAVAALALCLLSPIFLCVALAVRLDSPGPAVFRQRRNGFDQRQFTIYKFRTMSVLEDGHGIRQARRDDDRITRLGRMLRRTSIDELPQLLNVLRGDMSIVGPRPHALAHDEHYERVIGDYCVRHHVKPGITGWAQVNGLRGETRDTERMQRRVEYDTWYINNWSLALDLRIMVRTAFEVLSHDAY